MFFSKKRKQAGDERVWQGSSVDPVFLDIFNFSKLNFFNPLRFRFQLSFYCSSMSALILKTTPIFQLHVKLNFKR